MRASGAAETRALELDAALRLDTVRTPPPAPAHGGNGRFARPELPRRPELRPRPEDEMPAAAAGAELRPAPLIREGERRRSALRRDALHRRLLATADVIAAAVATGVAIVAAGAAPAPAALALLPLVVAVGKIVGLYDRDEHVLHKTTLDEAPSLLSVSMAFTLVVFIADHAIATATLQKEDVLLAGVALFFLMGLARAGARRLALGLAPAERLLVLGNEAEAARMAENIARVRPLKAELVGRVPIEHEPPAERGDDVLGILPDLDYVLTKHKVDRVVICPHGSSSGEMLDTIRLVKALGVKVSVVPRLFEVVGSSVEFDKLCGLILLGIRRYDLTKSSAFVKRAFDITGATLALVALLPLFLAITLAVKLTSSGPVFFRQRRVGRGGERFDMFKFRTMYDGADSDKSDLLDRNEADGFFKIAEDPRITPVGRWLRRISLDELPQLVNVLRGEMSLVGPRPLVDEEDARVEGWFRRRLDVTPGMTGAWQVLGSSRIPLRDMVTIDYLYRTNWSLWLDLKILLRTVPHVLRREGM